MRSKTKRYHLLPEENWILQKLLGKEIPYNPNLNNNLILTIAQKQGFNPYLFYIIKDQKEQFPLELYNALKKDYLSFFVRNTKIQSIWKELKTVFEANSLSPIPLKGLVLSSIIYPDVALRPMSDMDILFFDNQPQKASDLLLSMGGICNQKEADHDKKTGHHMPGISYKGIYIEIHRSLFDSDMQQIIPNYFLKKHLITVKNITTFNAELNFIYLSLHAFHTMRRGGVRLSWFLDLVLFAQKQTINFVKFTENIDELKVKEPVQQIVSKTEYLFDIKFDFIPDNFRKPLTATEKNKFIDLIHSGGKTNTDYSYAIALERLKNTKGLKNKVAFLQSVIIQNNTNPLLILKRSIYLSINLAKHLIHKTKEY